MYTQQRPPSRLTCGVFVATKAPVPTAKKTAPKKPKRRKPVRKEESIHIRLTAEQKGTLTEAATKAGLGLSTWLLTLGIREAQKTGEGSAK
jgi:hypothetical protein